ncbi:MAG TPA: saccharopine dehydrogenase NADP-binding domain-containing protein [Phycisphaerales bacterium]|nr:saccharopine dehydrogenase NADP-binding domain-containing protein [Phycisphaerales bacterium]
MAKVLVLGAGKVGKSVAEMLLTMGGGKYRVTVADRDKRTLESVAAMLDGARKHVKHKIAFETLRVDVAKKKSVRDALAGHDAVVCMLPFDFVAGIAEAANEAGVHYFDVTEDVAATEGVKAIAREGRARVALAPQCGLAPGYIAIAAADIARRFAEVHTLTLRVGALPQFPTNRLKYNVTWSADGVINEYCEPCNVMLGGAMAKVPALEGLENFSFEGVEYEAFYTSGGVGSLIETLGEEKRIVAESNVAYKTIRYPGHCSLMKFLLQDMRLGAEHAKATTRGTVIDRKLAVELLEHGCPRTLQDVVVIFINCIGVREGRREQVNLRLAIRAQEMFGRVWPAIESTTAAGVCAMVDLHRTGKLPRTGFIRQEDVGLGEFLGTPFGVVYNG